MITIEKRLPIGFKGEWGKVYKLYTPTEKDSDDAIIWSKGYYADIGQDVQFSHAGGTIRIELSQVAKNLLAKGEYVMRKTGDAYWCDGEYKCVVEIGDIVKLGNNYFVCDSIGIEEIETPQEQQVYQLGLKKIFDKILTGENNA